MTHSFFMKTLFSTVILFMLGMFNTANAELNLSSLSDNSASTFVTVDQAFPFNFIQNRDHVVLDWQVKPDYYLYQQRISVTANHAEIGDLIMDEGTPHNDEFFGDVNIYTTPLQIKVPLNSVQKGGELTVRYQGCAKAGFCYPPEVRKIPLSMIDSASNSTQSNSPNSSTIQNAPLTEQQDLAENLSDNWWTPLLFFGLGIGLAFTPCVLPMYPILTGIVLGGGKLSHGKAFKLSFVYVQGMALTYTLLGLVVASAGMQFQAALQHPYVLIALSVMFVALALSMFGLFTLSLPSSMQTWLSNLSNKQQGGSLAGVFTMGAISGLVCSPCTTAPLSGALIYVAQSGDLLTGAVALYALAIGMGIPLILAAMFGNKLLPKAGNWMTHVKTLFGFILLAVPVFLLERILPHSLTPYLWMLLGLAAFGWLYHIKTAMKPGWRSSLIGIIAILGIVASSIPAIDYFTSSGEISTKNTAVSFQRISNMEELNRELATAKMAGKPVMLDFYADWCVACKEFEKYTFHHQDVEPLLTGFVLLQIDVTKNSMDDIQLLKSMNVLGLPTIDFWDKQGNQLSNARLTGFMKSAPFIKHLQSNQLIP
ncbi:protein-disulfide reductase DsbD [Aliivibrio kagoshimensis]|uniref:protein-disulfide reductase DsbD n=1 Tax=Aliivibrio kagoshimensis TaxID=2910230 RepID=UPI003D0A4D0F